MLGRQTSRIRSICGRHRISKTAGRKRDARGGTSYQGRIQGNSECSMRGSNGYSHPLAVLASPTKQYAS